MESVSLSESHSQSQSLSISESESKSLSKSASISESKSLSESESVSLSQSQSYSQFLSISESESISLSESQSLFQSESIAYSDHSVSETAYSVHTEHLLKPLGTDVDQSIHKEKSPETMIAESGKFSAGERLSQFNILAGQAEARMRAEESASDAGLQHAFDYLARSSKNSKNTDSRRTEQPFHRLLRSGSQSITRDFKNVANELSNLTTITQNKEEKW